MSECIKIEDVVESIDRIYSIYFKDRMNIQKSKLNIVVNEEVDDWLYRSGFERPHEDTIDSMHKIGEYSLLIQIKSKNDKLFLNNYIIYKSQEICSSRIQFSKDITIQQLQNLMIKNNEDIKYNLLNRNYDETTSEYTYIDYEYYFENKSQELNINDCIKKITLI